MSTGPSIADLLTRTGDPVYGTSLTPGDFLPLVTEGALTWEVGARTSAGDHVRYVIRLAEDGANAFCDVDDGGGHRHPLLDPFRRTFGDSAPVQDWFDAICMEDAAGALSEQHERRWGGGDLGEVMTRVEYGISAYAQHEVAAWTFASLRELQVWIDRALANTQVRVEALVLSDFPYEIGVEREGQLLQGVVDDEVIGYLPVAVDTTLDSDGWLSPGDGRIAPRPRVELRMSGAERMGMNAGSVQSWDGVRRHGTLRGDGFLPERGGWVLLGVVGTDVALPLPWGSAHVRIETDADGAIAVLSVLPSAPREAFHRGRAAFERRWGRWLDDDVVLADGELDEGIARAEQALRAELAKETD